MLKVIRFIEIDIPILNGIQEEAPQARADESVQIAREEAESQWQRTTGFHLGLVYMTYCKKRHSKLPLYTEIFRVARSPTDFV